MPAPLGNQFWKNRSKHGRSLLFATPELLWEAAEEYFQWCEENPWVKKDWVGGAAVEVEREMQRPYTLSGLMLYCDANENYWNQFKKANHEDFSWVITRIEETIRTQKYEGAVVGVFNANIISRDLGLIDKKEHSGSLEVKQITGMTIL